MWYLKVSEFQKGWPLLCGERVRSPGWGIRPVGPQNSSRGKADVGMFYWDVYYCWGQKSFFLSKWFMARTLLLSADKIWVQTWLIFNWFKQGVNNTSLMQRGCGSSISWPRPRITLMNHDLRIGMPHYEFIISPKIWTKNCKDFYPVAWHSTGQKSLNIWSIFWKKRWLDEFILKFTDL